MTNGTYYKCRYCKNIVLVTPSIDIGRVKRCIKCGKEDWIEGTVPLLIARLLKAIYSINEAKEHNFSLDTNLLRWDQKLFAELRELNCAPYLSEALLRSLIIYFLIKRGISKSHFPSEESLKEELKNLYKRHFVSIYGLSESRIIELSESEPLVRKDIESVLACFEAFVASIPVKKKPERLPQPRLPAENEIPSPAVLARIRAEDERYSAALEEAGKRRKEAELKSKIRELELRKEAERKAAEAAAERAKTGKKEKALLEKEANELPKKEREVFVNSRKGVFCEECGNMNQLIKLSRGKIARLCMAHDRGIIAKYNPELLRPEKAKRKGQFEY